jgi:hypothetical protein
MRARKDGQIVLFNRLNKRKKGSAEQPNREQVTIGRGILYLHLIIVFQIAFGLGLVIIIAVMGHVLMTPLWLLLFFFLLSVSGLIYLYRKVKKQVRELGQTIQRLNLSGQNHEVSVMGGMFTLRVEHNAPKLPEALMEPMGETDKVKKLASK